VAIAASENRMDSLLSAVDRVDGELNAQFATSAPWQTIKSAWTDLKAKNAKLTPAESSAQHDALADRRAGRVSGRRISHPGVGGPVHRRL